MGQKVILAILDGLGLREEKFGNAVKAADKPNLDCYLKEYSSTTLRADGKFVGLPEGQMGNSEVGHLNIGAGRVVYQSLALLNKEIEEKTFFKNEKYLEAINHAKDNNSALHIMGLLSDGGVHAHINHIKAMINMAQTENVSTIYVHAFLDGRDVDPKSAKEYLETIITEINKSENSSLATVSGRYYAMDRDKRWDRVEKAYNTVICGEGKQIDDVFTYLEEQYSEDIYDEFIVPATIGDYNGAQDNDAFIFMNFRPDRAAQLAGILTNPKYNPLGEKNPVFIPKFRPKNIKFVATMKYSNDVIGEIAFKLVDLVNVLGDVVSAHGLKQLRIAETEKYPHVTFFFDGGIEKELPGAKRILINSPKVATYDLQPEMSAYEVTDALISELDKDELDLIILNFANPDMVGHSGMLEPTKKAIETIDECIGKITSRAQELNWSTLITADHGNSDKVLNQDGTPNTAHTTSPVPFILVDDQRQLSKRVGALCDIAPTILDLLGVDQPQEMTGESLLNNEK